MYLTYSKFTIVSYIIHIFSKFKLYFYIKRYFRKISLILIILSITILVKYSNEIINFDIGSAYTSYKSIVEQLLTIDSYTSAFRIFPDDYNKIIESFTNEVGNEVMYFTLIFQGGITLAFLYMVYFTSKLKHFTLFVLISMLHYGFSMSPLVIFLIITYNRKIDTILLLNEKK